MNPCVIIYSIFAISFSCNVLLIVQFLWEKNHTDEVVSRTLNVMCQI